MFVPRVSKASSMNCEKLANAGFVELLLPNGAHGLIKIDYCSEQ